MMLDGNSYIYCDDPVLISPAAFTLSSWHKRGSSGNTLLTLSGGSYGASGNELFVEFFSSEISVGNGATGGRIAGSGDMVLGTWANVIVAWTGTGMKVWING